MQGARATDMREIGLHAGAQTWTAPAVMSRGKWHAPAMSRRVQRRDSHVAGAFCGGQ